MGKESQGKNRNIGGLWLKTSKTGLKFMSGNIEGYGNIVVFKNNRKVDELARSDGNPKAEKWPDYEIYWSDPLVGGQGRDASPGRPEGRTVTGKDYRPEPSLDDEIPF